MALGVWVARLNVLEALDRLEDPREYRRLLVELFPEKPREEKERVTLAMVGTALL